MKTKTYLSKNAQTVSPYIWEETPVENPLKFDTNTLPFPPPSVNIFLTEMKYSCPINEYGDPTYERLKRLLSEYENIQTDMITITNSGDEAIDILAKSFLNPGDYFVITPPTYEMYTIQCTINNGRLREVPLGKSFKVNANTLIRESKQPQTKIIFLVNPNNPTGSIIPQSIIEAIVRKSDCIVVVDQAYGEFYGKTAVRLVNKYKNLVILKSFSKFSGLAGARIGYLIANTTLSTTFNAIRLPMGVSFLSYKLAATVLSNDRKWMGEQVKMILRERKILSQALQTLGYFVYPSQANFLLVNMGKNSKNICQKLKKKGILVRDCSTKPYLENCVRIAIRSPKENNVLINALKEIL
jgi:histidinol-phosphate aminotransferase